MKGIIQKLLMLSFVVIGFLGFGNVEVNANGLPINVEPVLPENQLEGVEEYIHIEPKDDSLRQTFQFKVKNITNKEQTVTVDVANAYVSPYGAVQYMTEAKTNSEIIDDKYKMTNYLKLDDEYKTITLKPNEEKTVTAKIDVEDIDGTLIGGIVFSTLTEGKKVEEEKSSFKINHKINMVMVVLINFGTGKEVSITIDEPYVDPMPSYYAVRLPITLESPHHRGAKLEYQVLDGEKELFSNELKMNMTPKSKTNYALIWEHDKIERNKPYTLKGKLTYLDKDDEAVTKEFEKEFVYTGKERKVNDSPKGFTVPFEKGGFPIWALILITLVVVAAVGFILKKKKGEKIQKETDDNKEEKEEKGDGIDE